MELLDKSILTHIESQDSQWRLPRASNLELGYNCRQTINNFHVKWLLQKTSGFQRAHKDQPYDIAIGPDDDIVKVYKPLNPEE